jgi:acyl-CoA hydrolase
MTPETTIQTKVIFPADLNDQGNLFGGQALKWLDEVAYIAAVRHTGKKMVTASIENLKFHRMASLGDMVEIKGWVNDAGNVKIKVRVEISKHQRVTGKSVTLIDGFFILVAVDENNNPVRLS